MASLTAVKGLSAIAGMCLAFQVAAADREQPALAEIEKVSERGALVLADGSELCLAGIWAPAATREVDRAARWRVAWRAIIAENELFRVIGQPDIYDRYGCAIATIENRDGASLQQLLLAAGWALVDPLSASKETGVVDAMLALEEGARSARRGIWSNRVVLPKPADDLSAWVGTRQLVEGRVQRVSETDRYVYLNFGNDWRTDFTTRLDQKMIKATGFDAAALDGKKLRVRGVLVQSRGPLIDIAHPKQIEFLP